MQIGSQLPYGKHRTILSLMSGTSVDTIDAAICEVWQDADGWLGCNVLAFHEHPMEENLRQRIFEAFRDGSGSLSLACSLNFEIGIAFAHATAGVVTQWGGQSNQIEAIASHGQTLYHIAPHMVENSNIDRSTARVASTLQLGEAAVIAALTGYPVISNFRVADMAMGGNGAPLVPFADYHLFSSREAEGDGIVLHNLGGIGNCTWLPPGGKPEQVLAFDTGPANMIIDGLVKHFYPGETYDDNGQHAAAGKILEPLLNKWMAMPYISAEPPKSTGRELFGSQFVEQTIKENPEADPDDLIATATEFTAKSLAENLRKFVMPHGNIAKLICAGGGAQNTYLVQRIATAVLPFAQEVCTLDDLGCGVTSKSRECAGFALLGYAHLEGIPSNLPSVTGAVAPVVLGSYTPKLLKA